MPSSIILHRTVDFTVCEHGTDDEVARISARMEIAVELGQPESGRFGPPENYDPGSGDTAFVRKAVVIGPNPGISPDTLFHWCAMWRQINSDALITQARETDDGPDPDDVLAALRDAQLEADAAWRRGP